ncbi:MAG: anaerobic ribonucleoside-triphosphate reductase activating protein [Oscillospiraceae bacterium]|nr:anaerobic ribonucleoside-triphosphate reductase activating protein [Oscillospiraceae bacterium]
MERETRLRVAQVVQDSVVDGPGLRLAVFAQGCPHRCEGCHNPQTHDPAGGYETTVGDVAGMARANPLLSGVTLTGGEPFAQAGPFAGLARAVKAPGLTVWVYSGWTFEDLRERDGARSLLEACDVLVDGPFILSQKSYGALYRGSRNQRLIDLPVSLREGRAILWEPPKDIV